jgi:hypothetical protein
MLARQAKSTWANCGEKREKPLVALLFADFSLFAVTGNARLPKQGAAFRPFRHHAD